MKNHVISRTVSEILKNSCFKSIKTISSLQANNKSPDQPKEDCFELDCGIKVFHTVILGYRFWWKENVYFLNDTKGGTNWLHLENTNTHTHTHTPRPQRNLHCLALDLFLKSTLTPVLLQYTVKVFLVCFWVSCM